MSCAVNPACGREAIYGIMPAPKQKTVLIVGGGVAGCECARVTAERGHKVILCEKSARLGGNLIPGGVPEFKRYDHQLVRWYERQLELLGGEVRLEQEMNAAEVERFPADTVVIATGSVPVKLRQEALAAAVSADDVLMGRVAPGDKVVMIGGGLVGCETGLWLAKQGKQVAVVEMLPEILGGPKALPFMNYSMLLDLMNYHGIKILKGAAVTSICGNTAVVRQGENTLELEADTVISAVGYRSENSLYEAVKGMDREIYNVGDSSQVHNIMYAVWNAYEVARNI